MSTATQSPPTATDRRLAALKRISEEFPDHPVTSPREANTLLVKAKAIGHLISPVDQVDYIPQMHAVSFRFVFLDPSDCYHAKHFCAENERALGQTAILKLWRQAGGTMCYTRRVDQHEDQLHRVYEAAVSLRGIDGRDAITAKQREVDLRPGSPQVNKNATERQLSQQRENVGVLAETKAQLRAVRAAMALRQKYTLDELERPFIIPTLVPLLDTSDVAVRRLVAAHALGIVGQLYGPAPQKALAPPPGVDATTGEFTDAELVDQDDDPAVANSAAGAPAETGFDPSDYEPAAAAASTPEPAKRCDCPCGCRAEVNAEAAKVTLSRGAHVRCASCWPGRRFEVARHQNLATLGLTPDVTVAEARARAQGTAA